MLAWPALFMNGRVSAGLALAGYEKIRIATENPARNS
jgi:hypothetical protein